MSKKHFIGIGGVGMAALATLEKALGHDIDGCDAHPSKRTRWLESLGIRVFEDHSPSHVAGADAIVATPAVPPGSPELAEARARGIPVASRGEELAAIVSSRESIAVCGSHGKTTTATFTAKLLRALGENASWAIGGETGSFPVAYAAPGFAEGKGPLVVEADESDGTLALYHPSILVVTNCEYDHPDHFPTSADYFRCFETARRNSRLVIEAESIDAASPRILEELPFLRPLPLHNRKNALAAREVALARGHSPLSVAAALEDCVRELPDRRFEKVFDEPGKPLVVADYAHHPTEIRCAIAMSRAARAGKLRVLFQPHRYSRTKALADAFAKAFGDVDDLVLCPVYAAFEKPLAGGTSEDLLAAFESARAHGDAAAPEPRLADSPSAAWKIAFEEAGPDDAILVLGAGDIIDIIPQAVRDMAAWRPRAARTQTPR